MKAKQYLIIIAVVFLSDCKNDDEEMITKPTSPSALILKELTGDAVVLSWNDNSENEKGFMLERKGGTTTTYVERARISANQKTFSDDDIQPESTYEYRVYAYNEAGNSGYANTLVVNTLPSLPEKPTNLISEVTASSKIKLSWQDNADNEDGFKVFRSENNENNFQEITQVGEDVTEFEDENLTDGTTYFYKIAAFNLAGDSPFSQVTSATTWEPPSVPTNVVATVVSTTQINLSWQDNAHNEEGFKIFRSKNNENNFQKIIQVDENVTEFEDENLSAGTTYFYKLVAFNQAGDSPFSQVTSATTENEPKSPPGISGPAVVDGNNFTITVTYSAWPSLGSNFDGYSLEESTTSSSSGYTEITTSPGGTNSPSYSFELSRTSGTYYYRARVYIGGHSEPGYSPYSQTIKVVVNEQKAILTIVNNTRYDMIDIRLNNIQKVGVQQGLLVGNSGQFEYSTSGTVNYTLGVGYWDNTSRNVWFYLNGVANVTIGQETTITFNNPTIGQLLSNFSDSRNWDGTYWDQSLRLHVARFNVSQNNTWRFYDDGAFVDSGNLILVSWPNYAAIITFKICDTCENILLPYPFSSFKYKNGPSSWPIIEYIAQ